jgi:hypothetical protein
MDGAAIDKQHIVSEFHGVARYCPYLLQHLPAPAQVSPAYPKLYDRIVDPRQVHKNTIAPPYRRAFFERRHAIYATGQGCGQIQTITGRIKQTHGKYDHGKEGE